MKIYGLKNCDACRKATKALPGAVLVDVRESGLPDAVLQQALDQFGDRLVNTRSTTWRSLDARARATPPADLIRAHPALMKRPLIVSGSRLFLGWNKDVEEKAKAVL